MTPAQARLVATVAGICSPCVGGTLAFELAAQAVCQVDDRVDLSIALAGCIEHRRKHHKAYERGWEFVTDRMAAEMVAATRAELASMKAVA